MSHQQMKLLVQLLLVVTSCLLHGFAMRVKASQAIELNASKSSPPKGTLVLDKSSGGAQQTNHLAAFKAHSIDIVALPPSVAQSFASPPTGMLNELVVSSKGGEDTVVDFSEAYFKAFTLMCTAEVFDRTWFVTLICSLHHGAAASFIGSFSALALHSVLAVFTGGTVATLLPSWVLSLLSALVLGTYAIVYAWESYWADSGSNALKNRMEEAAEDVPVDAVEPIASPGVRKGQPQEGSDSDSGSPVKIGAAVAKAAPSPKFWSSVSTVFLAIFIAEWGDRTQFVQISLAASLPVLPVILGSLSGLFLLCVSAVAFARLLEGRQIDERFISIMCCVCFGIMSALSFADAWQEYLKQHAL